MGPAMGVTEGVSLHCWWKVSEPEIYEGKGAIQLSGHCEEGTGLFAVERHELGLVEETIQM